MTVRASTFNTNQQLSTRERATGSISINYKLQILIGFHNALNLVRDQGVGGSNPLSPTNYLNPIIELASLRVLQFRQLESTWVVEANPQLFALLYVRPKGSNASKRLGKTIKRRIVMQDTPNTAISGISKRSHQHIGGVRYQPAQAIR